MRKVLKKIRDMLFESAELKREYYKKDVEKYSFHVGREDGIVRTLLAMGYTTDQIWDKGKEMKEDEK